MRVALFPAAKPDEPASFLALLQAALVQAGAVVVGPRPVRLRWALRQREVDVVHLHWLEYAAAPDPRPYVGWALTWFRVARLIAFLLVLRVRRVGIVWTVHNLSPHQSARPRAERACAQAVSVLADDVIVHSAYAAGRVSGAFHARRRRAPAVIPHANYIGAFPDSGQTREQARAALGIPAGAFVYLAFGLIRGYKRLTLLTECFSALEEPDVRLLIAGAPSQPEEVSALRRAAERDPRIQLQAEYVADEQVPLLHLAADAAVLAYADVFSSGALLLALSFGLPVVAPSGGTSGELFPPPAVELFDDGELAGALRRVREGNRRAAARASAEAFPWSAVAAMTLAVYQRARRTP